MKKLLFILSLFASEIAFSQDVHFSQFNDLPLNINPALSGNMDGTFRAGSVYRNQWNSVSVPFESTAIYTDFKLYPKFLNDKVIGVGVQLLNDRSGSGSLLENVLSISGSYHHFLNENKDQLLTAGINLGVFQKSIDISKLNFENQFVYETANFGNIASNENFENNSITKPDVGLGLSWTWFNSTGIQINAGISGMHLNRPNQSFYGNNDPLAPKINFHGSGIYPLSNTLDIDPSFIIMRQNQNTNFIFGADLVYGMGRKTVEKIDLKLGIYGRAGDAMSFTVGMNHDNWSIDLGYDLNVSSLRPASQSRGAFEISISYVNRMYKGVKDMRYVLPTNRLL